MTVDKLQSQNSQNLLNPPSSYFEYSILEAKKRMLVQQRTNEIKTLMRRSSQDIIDVGQKLIDVKHYLGHGSFRSWLKSEFNWSISAATKFMQVAEQFKCVNFAHLNITASALYLIAAPSTPQAAREAVLERTQLGENISYTRAKAIISHYKKIPNHEELPDRIKLTHNEESVISHPREDMNEEKADQCSLLYLVAESEQTTTTIKDVVDDGHLAKNDINHHIFITYETKFDEIMDSLIVNLKNLTPEQLVLLIIKATNRGLSKHQLEAIIKAAQQAINMNL